MISSNPLSRIENSEYKDLAGVRKSVENFVDENWGIDEKPPETKVYTKVSNTLPRVALLGPKHKDKW